MCINPLRWEVNYSTSWKWNISGGTGDDAVFFKEVHIANPSFENSYAYKGIGWESFYRSWIDRLALVNEAARTKQFSTQVSNWVDWVSHNNTAVEKEVFEQHFRPLNFKSRETFLAVFEMYSEQFDILIEDCVDFEEFETVIVFLQDLPHQILETMLELKASEEVPVEVRISYEGNTKQENAYIVSKMLETHPTSSFVWEVYQWNRRKRIKKLITSLSKQFLSPSEHLVVAMATVRYDVELSKKIMKHNGYDKMIEIYDYNHLKQAMEKLKSAS